MDNVRGGREVDSVCGGRARESVWGDDKEVARVWGGREVVSAKNRVGFERGKVKRAEKSECGGKWERGLENW